MRVHALIIREASTQISADLFWTAPHRELVPNDCPQTWVFACAWRGAFEWFTCSHVSDVGVVQRWRNTVSPQFSAHRRSRAPQTISHFPDRKTLDAPPEDEHTLLQKQESFAYPMRPTLHIQTVPIHLRGNTGTLTPPTLTSTPTTPDLARPLQHTNTVSCLHEVQTIHKSQNTRPAPNLTRQPTPGAHNPTKTQPRPATTNPLHKDPVATTTKT